jgi:hypothetical protein
MQSGGTAAPSHCQTCTSISIVTVGIKPQASMNQPIIPWPACAVDHLLHKASIWAVHANRYCWEPFKKHSPRLLIAECLQVEVFRRSQHRRLQQLQVLQLASRINSHLSMWCMMPRKKGSPSGLLFAGTYTTGGPPCTSKSWNLPISCSSIVVHLRADVCAGWHVRTTSVP